MVSVKSWCRAGADRSGVGFLGVELFELGIAAEDGQPGVAPGPVGVLESFRQALLSASSASAFLFSAQKVQASSGLGTYLQDQHSRNEIDLDEDVPGAVALRRAGPFS